MNDGPILHRRALLKRRRKREAAHEMVVALGRVYLEAGLPLAFAFEAAFADYRCGFIVGATPRGGMAARPMAALNA